MGIIKKENRKEYPDYTVMIKCDYCDCNIGIFDNVVAVADIENAVERHGWTRINKNWKCPNHKIKVKNDK